MAKKILAAANNKEQKYFMEEEFKFLPDTIKEDLKRICVYMAEKLNCTFLVGFDDNGESMRVILILTKSVQNWKSNACKRKSWSCSVRWSCGMCFFAQKRAHLRRKN